MTSRDFCFWLQGFMELGDLAVAAQTQVSQVPGRLALSPDQVDCVRKHLALVFKHEIDPNMGPPKHQAALDALHGAGGTHNVIPGPGPTMRC
jgi:hypothetical protein